MLTLGELKEVLDYCEKSGEFTWVSTRNNFVVKGTKAGSVTKKGYRHIRINNKRYFAHRLVWLYAYGEFPIKQIDHINGDKLDNRIGNLREATRSENITNRGKRKDNTSGFKGVSWHNHTKKWIAACTVDKVRHHLGYFNTPEEASKAYNDFAKANQGEFCFSPYEIKTNEEIQPCVVSIAIVEQVTMKVVKPCNFTSNDLNAFVPKDLEVK